MSRLKILYTCVLIAVAIIIFGFTLPALISAKDTGSVLLGLGVIFCLSTFCAMVIIPKLID